MCREKRQVKHSALNEPRFRRYYPASWCSGLGSWMLRFLLGWNAWELTQSALWVGIVSALMLAPALILSPYFGVQSDRVNPRHGLMWSMLIHGAIAHERCVGHLSRYSECGCALNLGDGIGFCIGDAQSYAFGIGAYARAARGASERSGADSDVV